MTITEKSLDAHTLLATKLVNLNDRVEAREGLSLSVTTTPIYEYREIWAEENATLNASGFEWSYGNGSTGYVGIPHDGKSGWEVFAMYFQADSFTTGSNATVVCRQFQSASNTSSQDVCSITVSSPTDGGGQVNHTHKYEEFATPHSLPFPAEAAPLGFFTSQKSGTVSDARVGVRLRRQIGEAITGVTLS